MCQDRRLVAAFIQACWLYSCNPDVSLYVEHELSDSDSESTLDVDVESDNIL